MDRDPDDNSPNANPHNPSNISPRRQSVRTNEKTGTPPSSMVFGLIMQVSNTQSTPFAISNIRSLRRPIWLIAGRNWTTSSSAGIVLASSKRILTTIIAALTIGLRSGHELLPKPDLVLRMFHIIRRSRDIFVILTMMFLLKQPGGPAMQRFINSFLEGLILSVSELIPRSPVHIIKSWIRTAKRVWTGRCRKLPELLLNIWN